MNPGTIWLRSHWSKDYLPNNMWVSVSSEGILAQDESLDNVVAMVANYDLNDIAFAFITFDQWQ